MKPARWGAALALAGSAYAACSAPFDPPDYINTLRVLLVRVDTLDADIDADGVPDPTPTPVGSYARPGETVTFKMQYADGRDFDSTQSVAPVLVAWIGGCWNPPGNDYYGCYEVLGQRLQGLQAGELPPEVAVAPGLTDFSITVPTDVLDAVGEPDAGGPRVAQGFVFFLVCAGTLGPVQQSGDTEAGSFPIGCFDGSGRELGAEGFVPGYTQVFVFDDGRRNLNPVVTGLSYDDQVFAADAPPPQIQRCAVSEEERRKSGCAATDEFTECTTVTFDVAVPDDVAEIDPGALDPNGEPLREVVWVSYFTDGGQFDSATKLVSDSAKGIQRGHETAWVPPEEPGLYTVWAVVRDNRGGSTIVQQLVEVTE
ncbi:MAG: hypothetical protein JNL21_20885 [Myxococcales bacterium]|nr:hypothetical protein [Myxococcales bacterium]